jgi:hypothetical protein
MLMINTRREVGRGVGVMVSVSMDKGLRVAAGKGDAGLGATFAVAEALWMVAVGKGAGGGVTGRQAFKNNAARVSREKILKREKEIIA